MKVCLIHQHDNRAERRLWRPAGFALLTPPEQEPAYECRASPNGLARTTMQSLNLR